MNAAIPALTLRPIGILRTDATSKVEAPRQPAAAPDITGVIELLPGQNLEHATEDLATWQRIWVIFWFHHNESWRPKVLPPRSTTGRKGVLSTRSPHRPNPLGLSALRLDRVEPLRLYVRDVDLLDGTPILDIKPYVPYTDAFADPDSGWIAQQDPRPEWTVQFSAVAEAQLAWIAQHSALPLRERVVTTLGLGPQPHPYRRIRQGKDGSMTLAVQDWRVSFRADAGVIEILGIRSGYRRSQLEAGAAPAAEAVLLHRDFMSAFWPMA